MLPLMNCNASRSKENAGLAQLSSEACASVCQEQQQGNGVSEFCLKDLGIKNYNLKITEAFLEDRKCFTDATVER